MLCGEYAILFGEKALAYTISQHLELYFSKSADSKFHVDSDFWDSKFSFKKFEDVSENLYKSPLIQALNICQKKWKTPPFSLSIRSQMDPSAGVGSSSAVILAACYASQLLSGSFESKEQLAHCAYSIQKTIQEMASGYDALTQSLGGLLSLEYCEKGPTCLREIPVEASYFHKYIHPYAGGKGSSTKNLVKQTYEHLKKEDSFRKDFLEASKNLHCAFEEFFENKNGMTKRFFSANQKHRSLLAKLPQFPTQLFQELENIPGCDETWTFKSTGAGGEDSFLFLGLPEHLEKPFAYMASKGWYPLEASFSSQGITKEDIHEI